MRIAVFVYKSEEVLLDLRFQAVILLDFSAVFTCPRLTPLRLAHALTLWIGPKSSNQVVATGRKGAFGAGTSALRMRNHH